MNRFLVFVLLMATTALGSQISTTPTPSDQSPPVTFNKDVLPIPGGTTDEEAPLPNLRLPTPPFASNGSPLGVIPSLIKLDKIK